MDTIVGICKKCGHEVDVHEQTGICLECSLGSRKKVFLGGTCNESGWRYDLIKMLYAGVDYFNPVVDDWTEDCMQEEIRQRQKCDFVLYVITPKMIGTYAIAEVVDDSNKRPHKTIFCILEHDEVLRFTEGQMRSLRQVKEMVRRNGAKVCENLSNVASFLNLECPTV